ncbi:hypothetical protein GIB67_013979 [Kingdonia uniflora]|uniref:Domain X domain-containing protein n=1 Tax=Kingdonia uniflora TaxID=39325 RepID=A0A7J7LDE3_9MAGN|nr:hypothetical protein GIB67_013979 [Kingdonia uniflora]
MADSNIDHYIFDNITTTKGVCCSVLFVREVGLVTRQDGPLTGHDWSKVEDDVRGPLRDRVMDKFDIDMHLPHVKYAVDKILGERLSVSGNIIGQNSRNRQKLPTNHCGGSKPFIKYLEEYDRMQQLKDESEAEGVVSKREDEILNTRRKCKGRGTKMNFKGKGPRKLKKHNEELMAEMVSQRKKIEEMDTHQESDKPEPLVMSKSKLRALLESDKPTFQDRVVQEGLLLVMEYVLVPRFSTKSHAFRSGRKAHAIIRTIRSNFVGYLWFLKVNLSDILENVAPNVMMGCLEKAVKEKKILKLIKYGLKAPVRNQSKDGNEHELKKKRNFAPIEAVNIPSYSHCGILSPLFANITLTEFDEWMKDKIVEFFRPSKLDSIWKENINDGNHNPAWPEFVPSCGREMTRKMDYIRYGDHVLVGIRGPREDAVEMRKDLIEFREFRHLKFVKGDEDPEPLPCTSKLYATQSHTNSQMNKYADWYKYADNRKKVVGFCAYVIRSSLAKLYAARYRLKSRTKASQSYCGLSGISFPVSILGGLIVVYDSIRRELKLIKVENIEDATVKAISIEGKYLKSDKKDVKNKSGYTGNWKFNQKGESKGEGSSFKGTICSHCKATGYNSDRRYKLYPELRPKEENGKKDKRVLAAAIVDLPN